MQTTMTRTHLPATQTALLTSRSQLSRPLPTVSVQPCTRQRKMVPQAYVRGNCGKSFRFGRGLDSQGILERMLRDSIDVEKTSSSWTDRKYELPLSIDAVDEEDAYVFVADVPGVDRTHLKVQIKDGKLTISGKRERSSQPEEAKKRRFSERHFGRFSRQLRLPQDADSKNIKAKVDNGVLTVRVSKLAQLPGVEDVRIDF